MKPELSKIIESLNKKDYLHASELARQALQNAPKSYELNKILAISLMALNKYNDAIIVFNQCFEMNQYDYDVNVNLAYVFNKVQDYKNALKFCDYALKSDKGRPEVYHNLANSYLYIPDLSKAEECILKSINLRGGLDSKEILNFQDTLNIYTDILLAKGDLVLFQKITVNLISRGVFFGDMFRKALRSDRNLIKEEHLDILYSTLEKADRIKSLVQQNSTKSSVFSCLAEYFEKSDKRKSEDYYIKSNNLLSNIQRGSLYDSQKFVKKIISLFENIKNHNFLDDVSEYQGEGIIFIIGMPRSGTTLLESILSTAESCVPGGEKVFFPIHCQSIIKGSDHLDIDKLLFNNLGRNYLDIIEIQRKGNKFFIDKLPENYLYYPFIRKSLPAAKFIHISRDPWDNAISLFKQNFIKEVPYASSFFGIALQYANYEYLMKKWNNLRDNKILNIQYENLVTNAPSCIRLIWDFCEFKGEYIEQDRKKHFAQTASKQQVNRSIYNSSLKKTEFEAQKRDFLSNLNLQREYWEKLEI